MLGHPNNEAALLAALRRGARVVDTAPNYGDGAAEALVGETLRRAVASGVLGGRDEVDLISKAGY